MEHLHSATVAPLTTHRVWRIPLSTVRDIGDYSFVDPHPFAYRGRNFHQPRLILINRKNSRKNKSVKVTARKYKVNTGGPYPLEKKTDNPYNHTLLSCTRSVYSTSGHRESITAPQGLRLRAWGCAAASRLVVDEL